MNHQHRYQPRIGGVQIGQTLRLPTVFDALRTAGGVTPFSKLSEVSVTRKRPLSSGGGKMRTTLDFLTLITEGNESQNIRLFDGDTVVVARSQRNCANRSSRPARPISAPTFIQVYVTGRVRDPGIQGAASRGVSRSGPRRRRRPEAAARPGGVHSLQPRRQHRQAQVFVGGTNPPVPTKIRSLMAGDVVRVNDSPLSATVSVLNEITGPAVGVYSVYSLFRDFQ